MQNKIETLPIPPVSSGPKRNVQFQADKEAMEWHWANIREKEQRAEICFGIFVVFLAGRHSSLHLKNDILFYYKYTRKFILQDTKNNCWFQKVPFKGKIEYNKLRTY